jgi:hypothetical protein
MPIKYMTNPHAIGQTTFNVVQFEQMVDVIQGVDNNVSTFSTNNNNKWTGRLVITIEAPTRREAKRILKEMFQAYGFAERPAGVKDIRLGNITQ